MEINSLNVAFISEWFKNPYKQSLIKSLESNHIYIKEYAQSQFFLLKILSEIKPNILHFQTLHSFLVADVKIYGWLKFIFFIFQLLILKLLGVKIVFTVHEWADKISDGRHDISSLQALILGKVFDAVITHCESTKAEMVEILQLKNDEKVFVIPHGNYIEAYENNISQVEARNTLKISGESLTFLMFGGIHKSKGILDGIRAFKVLAQPETTLIIAGKSGSEKLKQSILQEIKNVDNIVFQVPTDGIPDSDIQVYMNASDCVLLPYKIFTTSGVAVLSMSYAKACIAPQLGFFKDILDEQGAFLYDSEDENGLLNAMNLAVEKRKNLSEMGQYNFEIAKQWDWNTLGDQTYKVYLWCLQN